MYRSQPGSDLRPDFEHQVPLSRPERLTPTPAATSSPTFGLRFPLFHEMKGSSRVLYLGKEVISPVQRSAALNRGM